MTTTKEKFDKSIEDLIGATRRIKPKRSDKPDSPKSTSKPKPKPKGPTGPTWMAKGPTVDIGYLPKKSVPKPVAPKKVAPKPVAPKKKPPKKAAPQASLKDKYETAQSKHGKYSEQAGKALGDLHGIDISYDYPNMSADEMQEGLDKGTVSKKLYGKKDKGKLTQAERDEINERRDMRRGGSISADSYKLRKKSSKAKSGRVSKQTSWNY